MNMQASRIRSLPPKTNMYTSLRNLGVRFFMHILLTTLLFCNATEVKYSHNLVDKSRVVC